ncbi:hypothetical protein EV356DRAFT_494597 [Viridothelium virens]|uniref:Exosome complex protein n=1 Tax=Viridothelium virens TaxID=1048519 RepID=A0A6A6GT73_VIRVR|nr:hypothetical protein EV356DRAFT_494597 [Viridothelium virens]
MAQLNAVQSARDSLDATDIGSLLDGLEGNIDKLEAALDPVVSQALSETTNKMPVLDKAKFYIFVTYAIESILFSYLRLKGTNAKEHPVFSELARVKQYFQKVYKVENPDPPETSKPKLTVDKDAARRFVTAGVRQARYEESPEDAEIKRKWNKRAAQEEKADRAERREQKKRRLTVEKWMKNVPGSDVGPPSAS